MSPEEQVRRTIRRYALIEPGDSVVLAVSGGVDSLALLDLMHGLAPQFGCSLTVATFDHRWRNEAASEVARVVAEAARRGLACRVGAAAEPVPTETEARAQRRAFLRSVAADLDATAIATGHHLDDRVETMLMNLLRGAGTTGLGALPPRAGDWIRPLSELRRQDLESYAARRELPFCDDPTNRDERYLRNRVRHRLRPALEQLREGADEALRRSVRVLGEEREALSRYGQRLLAEVRRPARPEQYLGGISHVLLAGRLRDWPRGERGLVYRAAIATIVPWLREVDAAILERVDDLLLGAPDRGPVGQGGWQAWRVRSELLVMPPLQRWDADPVSVGVGRTELWDGLSLSRGEGAETAPLQASLRWPTTGEVRPRRAGDRYRPAGRGGGAPLSDLLAELGVPAPLRARVPVLTQQGKPVWVPGLPPAEGWVGETRVGLWFEP